VRTTVFSARPKASIMASGLNPQRANRSAKRRNGGTLTGSVPFATTRKDTAAPDD
jgi:hypothetical protein